MVMTRCGARCGYAVSMGRDQSAQNFPPSDWRIQSSYLTGPMGQPSTSAVRTAVSRRPARSAVIEIPHTSSGHHPKQCTAGCPQARGSNFRNGVNRYRNG